MADSAAITETRDLVTVSGRELSHNLGLVRSEVIRGSVVRWVDLRSNLVVGYLVREPPAGMEPVADDGLAERLAAPRDPKHCPTCKLDKPLSEFNLAALRGDGHDSICRACRSEWDKRNWRRRNGNGNGSG
jgi:hypothetical protein